MPKRLRILVNGLTLDDANLVPLTQKIKYWKKRGAFVCLLGTQNLAGKLESGLVDSYLNLGSPRSMGGGYSFILHSLVRNYYALRFLGQIRDFDTVYTVSSVLDLVLFPYLLKKTGKVQKWVSVFDNTVPLTSGGKIISGNPVIRLLAWLFFQISLFFLRSADTLFVVKPELKDYLLQKGFVSDRLVVTGNGVERDFILKAKSRRQYQTDALFVGRLNEAKGIYDLLSVAQLVKKSSPHFRLSLMGLGDETTMKKYLAQIKILGLTDNVRLLGFKTGQEKYDIIKSCKIFLFLSQTESVPVAPLEAVCSGKITLVYDLDAYQMYQNNEIIKFKQGDFRAVALKVIEILKNGRFLNSRGALLLDKYSWGGIAKTEYQHF